MSVTPLNDAPVARDDTATTPENTPVTIAPLANDSDVNGDLLTLTDAVTTNGTVSIVGTNLLFTPATNFIGTATITYTISDGKGGTASALVTVSVTPLARGCDLYPIALHEKSLAGLPVGAVIRDIYNGVQPGNFGWLTWAGSPNVPTLASSLTPPGDSRTYVNPNDRNDRVVSVGDWVQGKPGVSNSRQVRDALDSLEEIDITVPVWDRAHGQGNNSLYRVVAFARVRLISYHLPRQNRITAQFLGFVDCP